MGKKLFVDGGRHEPRSMTDIIGTSRHRSAHSNPQPSQSPTPTVSNQQTTPVNKDVPNRVHARRLVFV